TASAIAPVQPEAVQTEEKSPAEAAPLATPSVDTAEKAKAARLARPDASAAPEGSSTPTLPPRVLDRPEEAEDSEKAESRPAPAPRAAAPAA
ncbi:MAG: hypothetical protein Q4F27_03220, partial [Desulfovibrionaceae bacterium]|nr:hypothetical protein [Desulfovibrionaceae bacterium]